MNIVSYNPWRQVPLFRNRFNNLFSDFFLPESNGSNDPVLTAWNPAVDILDQEDKIVIKAELPGVDKKDIEVDLKDGVLTLKGERSVENEVKEDNYFRRERSYGKFQRAFSLPLDIDPDSIQADYKDGVLTVEFPKPEKAKPKQITVH